MEPILISLSPNTEPDDVALAWQTLLRPWRWHDQAVITRLEHSLAHYFGGGHVTLTSSGRSALAMMLTAFGIGDGDEVIVQAFTCIAVPAAVQWAGAKPVYTDIDETYNLNPTSVAARITSRTKAIIVQHTFGIPADMEKIKQIAHDHHVILIEDCAHALGATYHGQPLGRWGDAAILSFGRDKALSCVFGGAIITRDQAVFERLRRQQQEQSDPPSWWVVQQLLHPLILSIVKRYYFTLSLGKLLLVLAQRLHVVSKAVEAGEKHGCEPRHRAWRFSPALGYLLEQQWHKLDRYTAARQRVAAAYAASLPFTGYLREYLPHASWLRFPVEVAQPQQVRAEALKHRMMLGDWYDTVVAPRDVDISSVQYQAGSCPAAEAAAAKIINLPTYPALTSAQVQQVLTQLHSSSPV